MKRSVEQKTVPPILFVPVLRLHEQKKTSSKRTFNIFEAMPWAGKAQRSKGTNRTDNLENAKLNSRCRRFDVRCPWCASLGVCVRSVLLDHFIVDTQEQKRSSPLAHKQRRVILAAGFEYRRSCHRRQRSSQVRAGRYLGCFCLDHSGEAVFLCA